MKVMASKNLIFLVVLTVSLFATTPVLAQAFLLAQVTAMGTDADAQDYDSGWDRLATTDSLAADFMAAETMGFESMKRNQLANTNVMNQRFNMLGLRKDNNTFYFPVYKQVSMFNRQPYTALDAWGVKWQHDLDEDSSFALAASHSKNVYAQGSLLDTTSTMATASWTSRFADTRQSSLTGSVFLGDEDAAEKSDELSARRYYGFSVGGQMTFFKTHTPYLQLKLQKSRYDQGSNPGSLDNQYNNNLEPGYYSRLSAGWRWKVQGNWSVNAEANYSSSNNELNWQLNQSKLYFGTRYDFR